MVRPVMADWWRRLLYPELFDGDTIAGEVLSPAARYAAELAGDVVSFEQFRVQETTPPIGHN